jgi:hypothetical protein
VGNIICQRECLSVNGNIYLSAKSFIC